MLELQEPISGRYRLQQCLRRGGMSEVYLAYDEQVHRQVAIKLVSSDNAECTARLDREVQTMSKLPHDHILPTLNFGIHGSYHYLVMPYMERGTLRDRLARGALTQEEAGNILAQVASALQSAHDQGFIHRDIKPSNILLDNADEQYVYLADFGLAKVMEEGSDITQTGCLIGTPEYMAPELVDRPESASSDIYALGVLLYQMVTGRLPFTGSIPVTVYWKHLREQPVPPSQFNPAISHPVEQVILRAMDKNPRRRFLSPTEMAQAYAKALQAPEHSVAVLAAQSSAPAHVTLHKVGSGTLPTIVRQAVPQRQHPHRKIQKAIVSLVALVLLTTPLSLGFLIARGSTQAPSILSARLVHNTLQAQHPTTPARPVMHSLSGNMYARPLATPFPQHKHKHEHRKENGDKTTVEMVIQFFINRRMGDSQELTYSIRDEYTACGERVCIQTKEY